MSTSQTASLIHPHIDLLLIGGLSIIVFLALYIAQPHLNNTDIVILVLTSSILVNYPHFLSSYLMYYVDQYQYVAKGPRRIWVSFLCPLLLLSYLVTMTVTANYAMLEWAILFYIIITAWHYAKQTYGMFVTYSALKKVYFSPLERKVLLFLVYSLFTLSVSGVLVASLYYNTFGIHVAIQPLPISILYANYILFGAAVLSLIILFIRKYHIQKEIPPLTAIVSLIAGIIWLLPALAQPLYLLIVPFFHSLQYMLYVYTLKRNHYAHQNELVGRIPFVAELSPVLYCGLAILLGFLSFQVIPNLLTPVIPPAWQGWEVAYSTILVILFINIHHYFIDNVMWRKDNPHIAYLFKPAPAK